jgi:acetoin utilization deacetylase AcuC-like enzyme
MKTALLFHEKFLKHDAGPYHPESAERLHAIIQGLQENHLWDKLLHITPERANEEQICLVHTKQHFDFIRECSRRGSVQIDSDTHISAESFDAAMLAAGAAIHGVRGIMNGEFQNAFAAARPPGHHATRDRAMGFCLFNNIAIAARYLTQEHKLKRVLIMDWDVHHGNGTQDIFEEDPSVIYISLHRKFHYPGTGWEQERGLGEAKGTKINFPMGPPYDPAHYEDVFSIALSMAKAFEPEFILVSCGFDAHERDPLGNLGLKDQTYAKLTKLLIEFASEFGHQRIFSILEGGYDPQALANAGAAHISTLLST